MIYLDHAATTTLDPRVAEVVIRAQQSPLNPSSVHRHGQRARALLEQCREQLASLLGLKRDEVVFTSGASESNNLALRGLAEMRLREGNGPLRVLASPLEHSCIRETLRSLGEMGSVVVSFMDADKGGRAVIPQGGTEPFDLLCLMAVQNETGVIQRLGEARGFCERAGAMWLCDAAQAFASVPDFRVGALEADLVSLSAHKICGPAGVGGLVGPGVKRVAPQITGGLQEGGRRAGTQPVALIAGFVEAVRLADAEMALRHAHLRHLNDAFVSVLRECGLRFALNGDEPRHPAFLNLSVPGFSGPDLVIALDSRGFSVSAGSACSTGVMEISPILRAMYPHDAERASGGVRVSFGWRTTESEAVEAARALMDVVNRRKRLDTSAAS